MISKGVFLLGKGSSNMASLWNRDRNQGYLVYTLANNDLCLKCGEEITFSGSQPNLFYWSIPLDMRHCKEKVISYILKIFHQIMSHFIILIIKKNVFFFEKLGIVLKNFV